jgi:hypothetical protein
MNKHYAWIFLFSCLTILLPATSYACGYAWISDCSSQVQLRINGSLDSFNIADCPSGYGFNGIQLGDIQSLSLANAKTITWESCQNNVSAVQLRYRVYENGFPGGVWQSLNLPEYFQTIEGPYTTRYRSNPVNISLTNGLTPGKTYTIEVYLLAEVDTIGDDFIPETSFLRNNNGENYNLSFTYGGAAAPPIALLPHLTEPACYGANTGNIAVSAYGDLNGLFYQWSNISLNFYQQYNMSAGNYAITVTNSLGQSATASFQLGQPEPLQTGFTSVQSVGCNNSPGSATIAPSGGTSPYLFLWQDGQQTQTASLPFSGNWIVTITDAHQCTATGSVLIGNTGQVERSITSAICAGNTLFFGGQSFSVAGTYHFTTPGVSGCDTLTHLTLDVLNPAVLLAPLPEVAIITCAAPLVTLCAATHPAAIYWWTKDGVPVSNAPCLTENAGGTYVLTITLDVCAAIKSIIVTEDSDTPTIDAAATDASNSTASDGSASVTILGGTSSSYAVDWSNGASTPVISNLTPGTYCVTVVGGNGCSATVCVDVSFATSSNVTVDQEIQISPNPVAASHWIKLTLPEAFSGKSFFWELFSLDGKLLETAALDGIQGVELSRQIPAELEAGMVIIRLRGDNGTLVGKILIQ